MAEPFQSMMNYGILPNGGMAEWSIATVLKTVGLTPQGFESLSLRKKATRPFYYPNIQTSDWVLVTADVVDSCTDACTWGKQETRFPRQQAQETYVYV